MQRVNYWLIAYNIIAEQAEQTGLSTVWLGVIFSPDAISSFARSESAVVKFIQCKNIAIP